jgi:hypothetical protein
MRPSTGSLPVCEVTVKTQEERKAEQDAYLAAYPAIRERVMQFPGVVEVGVGLKETGGGLMEDMAFRVYVREKLPEANLEPGQVIPREIQGFRTDVIVVRGRILIIGFNDENDVRNYNPKVGGSRIGNDKQMHQGTLGCFARLNSDSSTIFLSNHHVLFADGAGVGSKVGQPQYEDACCCTCNSIGEVIDGDSTLDCAIGRLKSDVSFVPKVRRIRQPDNTVELSGWISGSAAPVSGDQVWKVGARTGLTRGTISQVTPDVEIHPLAPFTRIADHGDSGSVVVRLGGEVVALLYAIDREGGPLGLAKPIPAVLARLNITIIPSDETADTDVAAWAEDDALAMLSRVAQRTAFEEMVDALAATPAGRDVVRLFDTHRREILDLVNARRGVTVAWHRSFGPTWLAALARSAREPLYRIPTEVEGVTRAAAAARILAALTEAGSPALRRDVFRYGGILVESWARCDTAESLLAALTAAMEAQTESTVL